jgi:hypothetical protein
MDKSAPARWNAVSIIGGSSCCEAARGLKGRRFLSADAPRLPLSDCADPGGCRCVYRKYPDRRGGPRREQEKTGLPRGGAPTQDRRTRRGRRSTDE